MSIPPKNLLSESMSKPVELPLILTYLLNLFDLAFTMYYVDRFGIEVEANPIGCWMIQNGSVYVVKIVFMAIALYLLYRFTAVLSKWKRVCWIPLAVYSILTIYHLYIAFNI